MPIMEGWEVSPDRTKQYDKIMAHYPIDDPIITSKCKLDNENGFLVVSDDGFAWRIKLGMPMMRSSYISAGKSKWIRWHDVDDIIFKKKGQVLVKIKVRKEGILKLDKKGNPKIKKWKLTIKPRKGEDKSQWKQREENFFDVISKIYDRNKTDIDPETSDSNM
ncbi:MAG: hypothetical protein HWN67_15490 [Candidatus Helarchaeota archaeon]|nr:hypothetical protein [Candidatus Helarchaeota archaeon]